MQLSMLNVIILVTYFASSSTSDKSDVKEKASNSKEEIEKKDIKYYEELSKKIGKDGKKICDYFDNFSIYDYDISEELNKKIEEYDGFLPWASAHGLIMRERRADEFFNDNFGITYKEFKTMEKICRPKNSSKHRFF